MALPGMPQTKTQATATSTKTQETDTMTNPNTIPAPPSVASANQAAAPAPSAPPVPPAPAASTPSMPPAPPAAPAAPAPVAQAPVAQAPTAAPQAAPAAPQMPQEAPSQQLAAAQQSQVPQAAGGVPSGSLNEMATGDGFEGLDFDAYGVFPVVKLHDGSFSDSEETDLGTEFDVVMMSSRPKFLYKTNYTYGADGAEVVYSYDNITSASGVPLTEIFAEWRAAGKEPAEKPSRYIEVTARKYPDGDLVLLSVPAAGSGGPLTAYWASLKFKNLNIKDVVTTCFKGKRVDRAAQPFTPWGFRLSANQPK